MKRALIVMALLAVTAVGTAVVYQAAARERDYRMLLARGDAAHDEGQTFAAIEDYSGAIALRPDSMLAHLRRGETYRQRADLDAAGRDFRAAAALNPSATRPLEEWGDVLYLQGRHRRAADVYESRLRLDDRSAAIWYRLGLSRYRDGNLAGAIAALEGALRLDGNLPDAHYLLGVCLREQNRLADAVAAQKKALALAPGLIAAREELAELYHASGRRSDEIEELQMLAGLDSARVERRVAVGLAHAQAGHLDLAVLTLANALDQTPDQPIIYGALGRVWLDIARTRGDRPDALGKALESLERAASAPSATSEVKTLYGRALRWGGQLDAAERVLQQATERFPVDASAFSEYAAVAQQLNHIEEARTALVSYSALVKGDADFVARSTTIGTLSLRLNDPSTAVVWLQRATDAAPNDVRPIALLAEAELRAGYPDRAKETAARGLQIDPKNRQLLALARRLS